MKSGNFTSLIRELMAIFFMSLVLALMYNAFSQKGLSLIRTTPQKVVVNDSALFSQPSKVDTLKKDTVKVSQAKGATSSDQHSPAKSDSAGGEVKNDEISYKILTLAQVRRLIDERRVLLIDARDAEAYKKAHIKGAINIFGDEPEQHFEELTNKETAEVLGIEQKAASIRYVRALEKLKSILKQVPGFFDATEI